MKHAKIYLLFLSLLTLVALDSQAALGLVQKRHFEVLLAQKDVTTRPSETFYKIHENEIKKALGKGAEAKESFKRLLNLVQNPEAVASSATGRSRKGRSRSHEVEESKDDQASSVAAAAPLDHPLNPTSEELAVINERYKSLEMSIPKKVFEGGKIVDGKKLVIDLDTFEMPPEQALNFPPHEIKRLEIDGELDPSKVASFNDLLSKLTSLETLFLDDCEDEVYSQIQWDRIPAATRIEVEVFSGMTSGFVEALPRIPPSRKISSLTIAARITASFEEFLTLLKAPQLSELKEFTYNHPSVPEEEPYFNSLERFRELFAVESLSGLEELDISIGIPDSFSGDEVLKLLAGNPQFASLSKITLKGPDVTNEGIRTLTTSPHIHRLTALNFEGKFTKEAIEMIQRAPNITALKEISLWVDGVDSNYMMEVIKSPKFRTLEVLDLKFKGIDNGYAIYVSHYLPHLREFHADGGVIDDVALEIFAQDGNMKNLERLNLYNNKISSQGVRFLALSPNLIRLKGLFLGQNGIGDEGAIYFAYPTFPVLERLNLGYNPISDESVVPILSSPYRGALVSLTIWGTEITKESIKAAYDHRDSHPNLSWINFPDRKWDAETEEMLKELDPFYLHRTQNPH